MKLLIIPSWYPSNIHPESGTFFRERALILQNHGFNITIAAHIVHSARDVLKFIPDQKNSMPINDNEMIVYKTEALNPYPKLPKQAFKNYKKSISALVQRIIAKQGKPDLVFIHSSLFAGAALAKYLHEQSIPYMVSEHLKEFIIDDGWTAFQKVCINNSYNYASRIIATSTALKNNIQSEFNISDEKIALIPNPADVQSFSLRIENTEGPFTFIAIALLRQEKRLDILINAFAKLIENMPDAVLTIVGDGPEKDNLELLSRKLNISKRVNFTGYQKKPAVAEMLRHHHALVLSSEVETFGVALVEAMTAGLPVIATRCGGPESIVSLETGILVKRNDSVKLAKAMQKIIDNYSIYDPNKIRQIALEEYGDKAYVAHIADTINSIDQAKR